MVAISVTLVVIVWCLSSIRAGCWHSPALPNLSTVCRPLKRCRLLFSLLSTRDAGTYGARAGQMDRTTARGGNSKTASGGGMAWRGGILRVYPSAWRAPARGAARFPATPALLLLYGILTGRHRYGEGRLRRDDRASLQPVSCDRQPHDGERCSSLLRRH